MVLTQLDLHANSFLRANALPCVEMIDLAGLINPHAMVKGMILCTVRWRGWCEGVFDQNSHYSAQYIRRKSKYTQFFKCSSTLQSAHYSLMVCKRIEEWLKSNKGCGAWWKKMRVYFPFSTSLIRQGIESGAKRNLQDDHFFAPLDTELSVVVVGWCCNGVE